MRPASRQPTRRTFLQLAAGGAAVFAPGLSRAQSYPAKPIKLILPYAAGGGPDVLTRVFADKMGEVLGQRVVIDNRVGAGGILAGQIAAQAPPDGYTILLGSSSHVTQKLLEPKAEFDPMTSFTHIMRLSTAPTLLVAEAEGPFRSAADLVAAAKAAPGKFNYGSGGIGSAAHLAGAGFANFTGIDVVHVPFRGSVEIVPAILSKTVEFAFPIASTAVPQVKAGKVRALATTAPRRLPQLPDVPTLKELYGSDDLVLESWSGLWGPANLPPAIVAKLNEAALTVARMPEIIAVHERIGSPIDTTATPAEFTAFMRSETAKYTKLVAAAKIGTQR
ncbi:MAG: tripartite tricarboxylate transporter substrate binding protein [Ferrovibrio sp.]|uniref:Bug family tripartite tricarboxylate transporter substrate binding protein n=1 Tax=Ferrovibrio sp. TaxID=1917215 RepID=UPI00260380BA|nr:tripartite tricarboxylate transporter substrate binding protein [Ferrovibrio sp.]MCW0236005.1 tripartite tricarboxylate transporter substrate binding protein [Ferrovibrio sp.]